MNQIKKKKLKKLKKDNFISKLKNFSSEYNLSLENDILKYENDEINKSELKTILEDKFQNLSEDDRKKLLKKIKPKKRFSKKDGKNFDDDKNHDDESYRDK